MKSCQDEVVAILEVYQGNYQIRETLNYANQFVGLSAYVKVRHKYQAPILLVTESPHIEEFKVPAGLTDLVTRQPVHGRPVNGVSGRNIRQKLAQLLFSTNIQLADGRYPVIVINALQQQCSLGQDTLRQRTRNFLRLWPEHQGFLRDRLTQLKPLVAINACTVGDFYLADGLAAYASGNRGQFSQHFTELLENEFGYLPVNQNLSHKISQPENDNHQLIFTGSLDLAGLVMTELSQHFQASSTALYKTSHPSSWGHRLPKLYPPRRQLFCFAKQAMA